VLRLLLEQPRVLTVAAEPQIGAEAMAHVAREAFDFIFIDMHLPEANRIAIARRILEQRRDARLLVLSRGRAWHRREIGRHPIAAA